MTKRGFLFNLKTVLFLLCLLKMISLFLVYFILPRGNVSFSALQLLLESQAVRSVRDRGDLRSPVGGASRTAMQRFPAGIPENISDSWKRREGWTCWFESHSVAIDKVQLRRSFPCSKPLEAPSDSAKPSQLLSKVFDTLHSIASAFLPHSVTSHCRLPTHAALTTVVWGPHWNTCVVTFLF